MNKESIKQAILSLIKREGDSGASVGQIQSIAGCDGTWELHVNNLCLAWGLSEAAVDALNELRKAKAVDMEPVHWLIPSADGTGFPGYPIATPQGMAKGYKTPHYSPVLFTPYPSPSRKKTLQRQEGKPKGFKRR